MLVFWIIILSFDVTAGLLTTVYRGSRSCGRWSNIENLKPMSATAEPCSFRLGYITDVEGNLDYFLRFASESNVLDVVEGDASSKAVRLDLRGNCYFVYGGDAVDKGPGDIRMVRALVDLKHRYPDRVSLLVGNRDLNKLRFSAELSHNDMQRPIDDIPPPHWDPEAPTLRQFLERKRLETCLGGQAVTIYDLNTRVNRLHYLLEHTLGCPNTFGFRRQELSILTDQPVEEIPDESVLESFLFEVENPDGSLRQYLEAADVAVCIGNTLFCHGCVDRATMKFIPSHSSKFENPTRKPLPGAEIDNVQEWCRNLNMYLKAGLKDYEMRPNWDEFRTTRGGETLMALQNRPAMWGRSIVSNCYGDGGCITTENAAKYREDPERKLIEERDPLIFENVCSDPADPVVAEWLLKDGIRRVVVGHKPTGDCPAVLSALYTGVEIVSADTSFSDTSVSDNRGAAFASVEVAGSSSTDNCLSIKGSTRDGYPYLSLYCRLCHEGVDKSVGDPMLGRRLDNDGWWVKVGLVGLYYLTRGQGRKVEYRTMRQSELFQLMDTSN